MPKKRKVFGVKCPHCGKELGLIIPRYSEVQLVKFEDTLDLDCEECGEEILTREEGGSCKECGKSLCILCGGPEYPSELCKSCEEEQNTRKMRAKFGRDVLGWSEIRELLAQHTIRIIDRDALSFLTIILLKKKMTREDTSTFDQIARGALKNARINKRKSIRIFDIYAAIQDFDPELKDYPMIQTSTLNQILSEALTSTAPPEYEFGVEMICNLLADFPVQMKLQYGDILCKLLTSEDFNLRYQAINVICHQEKVVIPQCELETILKSLPSLEAIEAQDLKCKELDIDNPPHIGYIEGLIDIFSEYGDPTQRADLKAWLDQIWNSSWFKDSLLAQNLEYPKDLA